MAWHVHGNPWHGLACAWHFVGACVCTCVCDCAGAGAVAVAVPAAAAAAATANACRRLPPASM
eukprot:9680904-Lingulodinium_polyedra.AAC.1